MKITIVMTTRLNPQMPTKHTTILFTLEVTTEKKLWTVMNNEENDAFSSYVALDDVMVLEAAELDAIALLFDTWDNDIDPEVHSWYKPRYKLTFPCKRRKKKAKAIARADTLFVHHMCLWRIVDDD